MMMVMESASVETATAAMEATASTAKSASAATAAATSGSGHMHYLLRIFGYYITKSFIFSRYTHKICDYYLKIHNFENFS